MQAEALASDPVWVHRFKTWVRLKKFGRFAEVSERSRISLDDLDYAARYGDYQWVGGPDGDENIRCQNLDSVAIQTAIDDLSGRTKRQVELKRARAKAGERKEKHRGKRKVATLLAELEAADFVVFPTEILNSCLIGGDGEDNEFEMQDGLEIVSRGFTSPAVEYWEAPAREQRAKAATATRVAKHRRTKAIQTP